MIFGLICPGIVLTDRLLAWVNDCPRRALNYWMFLELVDDLLLQHRFQKVCMTCVLLDERLHKRVESDISLVDGTTSPADGLPED